MPYIPDQQINTGFFVPTTNVWDAAQVRDIDVTSPEFKELMVRLYQNLNNMSVALNAKVTGICIGQEFVNGKQYYNPNSTNPLDLRPGYTITVNTGALGAGANPVNHNLAVTNTWKWMAMYGAATNTGTLLGYSIPDLLMGVNTTATQIIITNNTGLVFTDSTVTLEYVKY